MSYPVDGWIVTALLCCLCEHLTWCHHRSLQRLCREVVMCWARLQDFSPQQQWVVQWQVRGWCAEHWRWQKEVFYLNMQAQHLERGQQESIRQANRNCFESHNVVILFWLLSPCKPLGRSIVFTSSSAISNAFNPPSFLSQNNWRLKQTKNTKVISVLRFEHNFPQTEYVNHCIMYKGIEKGWINPSAPITAKPERHRTEH